HLDLRRHGVRAAVARAAARDRRLRAPAHRRAAGRRASRGERVPAFGLGGRRLERDPLRSFVALPPRPAEEVDAPPYDLDNAASPALLFPVAAPQVPVDADPATLAQVLGAEL